LSSITDLKIGPSHLPSKSEQTSGDYHPIESLEAIRNIDTILIEVGDHIDNVWLGSLDARVSMDLSAGGMKLDNSQWREAKVL
jgi:hypothetical protein